MCVSACACAFNATQFVRWEIVEGLCPIFRFLYPIEIESLSFSSWNLSLFDEPIPTKGAVTCSDNSLLRAVIAKLLARCIFPATNCRLDGGLPICGCSRVEDDGCGSVENGVTVVERLER